MLGEIRILLWDWSGRARARRYRDRSDLKLHLGCGPNIRPGWVNVDLNAKADLRIDLRKSLPFVDDSCVITHSEHFLEHLDFPDGICEFLRECFRVTKPGGRISIGVPDAGGALMRYAAAQQAGEAFFRRSWHPEWVVTWMMNVNFLFRQNYVYDVAEHRFAFDFETLKLVLEKAGFRNVERRGFDSALDSLERKGTTMYVSALKPPVSTTGMRIQPIDATVWR